MSIEYSKRLAEIRRRIDRIKAKLAAIDDMRPGSLTCQYKNPEHRNGPYYQLSYTREMKSRTEYIARDCLREVRRQIGNYQRFKGYRLPSPCSAFTQTTPIFRSS